jgi:uncharacterized protein YjbJ (UPF0337 family)
LPSLAYITHLPSKVFKYRSLRLSSLPPQTSLYIAHNPPNNESISKHPLVLQTTYLLTKNIFIMADNSSTLKSYVDSATGAAQNALGNLTGNAGDQAQGEARKNKAEAEHDLSHATAKVPGGAISGSGAFSKDDPNRTEGSWNQTVGSAKETLGGLIGNEVSPTSTADD